MLEFYHQKKVSLERIIEKMCHAPADCFEVKDRGYLREGYFADLVLLDTKQQWTVHDEGKPNENVLYKCGWSPFDSYTFSGKVLKTFINGNLVFDEGKFFESVKGERLAFNRN